METSWHLHIHVTSVKWGLLVCLDKVKLRALESRKKTENQHEVDGAPRYDGRVGFPKI